MKKILIILTVALLAGQVNATPNFDAKSTRQQKMAQRISLPSQGQQNLEKTDVFGNTPVFRAAQQGDLNALADLARLAPNGDYLLRSGNNKNNVFHVARNLETFKALIYCVKHFFPQDYQVRIHNMLEQKNNSLETPLRAQLNYGRADIYLAYFNKTDLYEQIISAKNTMQLGGLLADVVGKPAQESILKDSKDLSGLTPAQTAARSQQNPKMVLLLRFFEANAPYLVNPV